MGYHVFSHKTSTHLHLKWEYSISELLGHHSNEEVFGSAYGSWVYDYVILICSVCWICDICPQVSVQKKMPKLFVAFCIVVISFFKIKIEYEKKKIIRIQNIKYF